MGGRAEQRRRAFHVKREVETELRRIYAILEQGDLDLLRGYLQARLGMAESLERIKRERGIKSDAQVN